MATLVEDERLALLEERAISLSLADGYDELRLLELRELANETRKFRAETRSPTGIRRSNGIACEIVATLQRWVDNVQPKSRPVLG